MPYICCVPGCNTTGKQMFHSFPKESVRCQRWIHSLKCFHLNNETAYKTHHKVCRIHFQPEDYTSTMQKYLKNDSVPTLHLPALEVAEKYLCLKNASASHESFKLPCIKKCLSSIQPKEIVTVTLQENVIENIKPQNENNEVSMDHDTDNETGVHTEDSHECFELPCIQKYLNLIQFKAFVTVPMQEIILKNLETILGTLNQNIHASEQAFVNHNPDNHTGAHIESVYPALNSSGKQYQITTSSNIQTDLVYEHEYPKPYLTDDIDDSEIFQNIDLAEADSFNITDNYNTSPKNIFELNDTLVPEPEKISNPQSKTNVRPSFTYDPAARRARYQATRIKFLTKKLRNSEKLQFSQILKHLERILDENQMTFVNMQIKNAGRKPRGHRFSFEEKCMAFAIYKQSPKCYRFLSSLVTLPCKQTLMKHSASIRFEAGINPKLMSFLSDVVKDMDELDKLVTIGWDEMGLNAHLDYCKVKDYIDGFVDDGSKTTDEFATHALVFMVRGINKSFKQPIAYFLTQNINKDGLAELIRLVVEAVLDTGLKIMGSVCDAVSTNLSAVKKLMKPEMSRLPTFALKMLEYRIRDTSIIHYFDPPHLIKTIRNNMLSKDLHHFVATKKCSSSKKSDKIFWDNQNKAEKVASWDDVSEFYEYNRKGINQLLDKITDEHIEPKKKKMKVSTAVQVFSRTFGTTMRYCSEKKQLSWDFTGTADVLIFFNELFDSLNGGGLPSAKDSLFGSVHQQSYHFTFWKYAVEMLKKMKFVPKDPEAQEKSRVLNDYILTINGLTELTKRLFDLNVECVSIRMMTQDALENFFGGIRAYCHAAVCPTPRNFKSSYTTSLFNNLSSRHSIKSNCEDDGGFPLIRDLFSKFASQQRTGDKLLETENFVSELDEATNNYLIRKLSTVENEAENYIAGHICKTVLSKNECMNCEKSISSRGKNEKYHGLLAARSDSITDNKLLKYPKPKLIDCLKKVASRLEHSIPLNCFEKSLSKKIIRDKGMIETFAGCDLHKTELTQQFTEQTFNFLITGFTNKVNSFLSGKVDVLNDPYDRIQKAAFDFRQKKKHIVKFGVRNE